MKQEYLKQIEEKIKKNQKFIYDNLFSILNIETDEMSHSKFLAYLLAPNGEFSSGENELTCKHNCGTEFLRNLLSNEKLKINDDILDNLGKPKVIVEYVPDKKSGRRIDIFIQIGTFAVVIENKIYASDQQEQLKSYHDILKNKNDIDDFRLVYLTLDGKEPSDDSKKDLSSDDYIKLSYKDDIKPWLEECITFSPASTGLKINISSYLQILEQILYFDELSSLMLKAECNIDDIKGINNSTVDKNRLGKYLFEKRLRKTVLPILEERYKDYVFSVEYKNTQCRVYIGKDDDFFKILYEFRTSSASNSYGIWFDKRIKNKINLEKIQKRPTSNENWWIFENKMKGQWQHCNNNFFNNFNEEEFKKYIDDAADKIDKYITEKEIEL